MHEKDFPALRIGNRIVVPKAQFIQWAENYKKPSNAAINRENTSEIN